MQVELQGVNFKLNDGLKEHVERRLHFALGRFAEKIDRLTVRFTDTNGPRGGVDKQCRMIAALHPRGQVAIQLEDSDPFALSARAAKRLGRTVRRVFDRRRWTRS